MMLMHIKYRSLPTIILRIFFDCAKTDAWVGFELHLKSVNLIFSHRTDLIHSILSPSVIQLLRDKVRVLKKEKTRSKLAHNPSSYKVRHPLEKLPSHPLTIIILISLFLDCFIPFWTTYSKLFKCPFSTFSYNKLWKWTYSSSVEPFAQDSLSDLPWKSTEYISCRKALTSSWPTDNISTKCKAIWKSQTTICTSPQNTPHDISMPPKNDQFIIYPHHLFTITISLSLESLAILSSQTIISKCKDYVEWLV